MNDRARIYFDTNVFIAMHEGEGASVTPIVELVAKAQESSEPRLATSELTLSELLVLPVAKSDIELATLYERTIAPSNWLFLQTVDRTVLRLAARLRARQKSLRLPDAIHIATAVQLGCTHFLTADTGISGPFTWSHPVAGRIETSPLQVVRPGREALLSLADEL